MKIKLAFFVILLTNLVFSQNDTILKYFRTVTINKDRKIVMQSSVDKITDLAVKVTHNYYSFKKDAFSVADSMGVEVNEKKQIIAIHAIYNYVPEYSNDTAYIHEQRKYFRVINSRGREFQYNSMNTAVRVTKWEDSKTIFELIEVVINGKKQIYSVIFDIELYYKKFKSCIDLKKNENSIELLKRLGLLN